MLRLDSQFYNVNSSNRRTLGIQPKSISFRTHEIVDEKHSIISHRIIQDSQTKILSTPTMAYLTRLYLLGRAEKLLSDGSEKCQQYDFNQIKTRELHTDQAVMNYFNTLPEQISFKLVEFEKQILYLKCWINNQTVVTDLRHLYHADINLIDLNEFDSDEDLLLAMYTGLSHDIVAEMITFHQV